MVRCEAKGEARREDEKGDRAGRMLRRSLLLVPTHTRVLQHEVGASVTELAAQL